MFSHGVTQMLRRRDKVRNHAPSKQTGGQEAAKHAEEMKKSSYHTPAKQHVARPDESVRTGAGRHEAAKLSEKETEIFSHRSPQINTDTEKR